MKVKELIAMLEEMNPDATLVFIDTCEDTFSTECHIGEDSDDMNVSLCF